MEENGKWRQVMSALEIIRPYIQGDGGDIELVEIDDENIVTVRLTGNCVGCGSAETTLVDGVQSTIMGQLPWVRDVRADDQTEGQVLPRSAGACGQLSSIMRNIEEKMRKLEFDVLSSADTESLPKSVGEWSPWIRSEYQRLSGTIASCLAPMAEVFLPSAMNAVESVVAAGVKFVRELEAYEQALAGLAPQSTELFGLFQSTQQMLRALRNYFLRAEGVLFEMLDEVLPEELRSETRTDIANYLRRAMLAATA